MTWVVVARGRAGWVKEVGLEEVERAHSLVGLAAEEVAAERVEAAVETAVEGVHRKGRRPSMR